MHKLCLPATRAQLNEMNQALAQMTSIRGFVHCGREDCIDSWVVVSKPDDKYIKVARCPCFKDYKSRCA